jgi:hypothetical protein
MQISKRQRRLAAQKLFKQPVSDLEQCDLSKVSFIPKGMTRAYRNNRYTIMVFDNHNVSTGTATRVMIQKHDDTPILNHWAELFKIKNEIFGDEIVAIEYYPAKSELIDDHNIYWLWIYPPGVLPLPKL